MNFIVLHRAAKDISGHRFGRLEALGPVSVKKFASGANHVQWLCRCDCGTEKIISIAKLSTGNTKSCGCYQQECRENQKGTPTHGMHKTPEYEAWHALRQRCLNPNNKGFPIYGGRGIKICERWDSFENFFEDMGARPSPDHSIDRYPNQNGNYEKSNCRWATRSEQQRNLRSNFIVTAFGRTGPLCSFVEDERHFNRARSRIKRGWDAERAITEPRSNCGPVATRPMGGFWRLR